MSLYYLDIDCYFHVFSDFDDTDFYNNWAAKICVLLQLVSCASVLLSRGFTMSALKFFLQRNWRLFGSISAIMNLAARVSWIVLNFVAKFFLVCLVSMMESWGKNTRVSLVKLHIFQIIKSLTHDLKKHHGREHS